MELIFVAIIILFVLEYTKRLDTKKFFEESEPLLKFLMESDYKFLLSVKYGDSVDSEKLFKLTKEVGNAIRPIKELFKLRSP